MAEEELENPRYKVTPGHPFENKGFVYVMRGRHGSLKVGFSYNPVRRLGAIASMYDKSIQILGVWVAPDAGLLEGRVHRILTPYQSRGSEWYDCEPLVAFNAVMQALNEQTWPQFVPTPQMLAPIRPSNGLTRGYVRDHVPTPITQQKSWLASYGDPEMEITSDDGIYRNHLLYRMLNQLCPGDRVLVYAPHVFGDEREIHDVLQQIEDHEAIVEFAKPIAGVSVNTCKEHLGDRPRKAIKRARDAAHKAKRAARNAAEEAARAAKEKDGA